MEDLRVSPELSPNCGSGSFGSLTALDLIGGSNVNTGVTPIKYTYLRDKDCVGELIIWNNLIMRYFF